jgi:hypothetical protein
MKYCFLLVLAVWFLMLPSFYATPVMADLGEPLVAMIVNELGEDVGPDYEMYLNESVTFIAIATGGYIPYSYFWYVDGVAVPTYPGYVFVYAATEPGEHSLVLDASELYGQSYSDTLLIRVYDPSTPVRSTTWGIVKELFGQK